MLQCTSWPNMDERRWRPNNVEVAPNCPRCASSNTKFCYYNNYSLSQPRYFCKGCRRYWTKGGSLRNVPVGGGCRKSRRAKWSASRNKSSISTAYCKNFNGSSPSGDSSSSSQSGSRGPDIDLAAVFAKYLNQESEFEKSNSGRTDQELGGEANIGCINAAEAIQESNLTLVGVEECQDLINEYSVETDPTLLSDHEMTVRACTLRSDSTEELQSLMLQLEEFDSFPMDDKLQIISADLTSEINNWNSASFDLFSGIEVFQHHN